jgi:hypothetical protein
MADDAELPAKQSPPPDEVASATLYLEQFEASFRGPLPPPATLAAYDRALPGLAERIVAEWEGRKALVARQVEHCIAIEGRAVEGEIADPGEATFQRRSSRSSSGLAERT